MELDRSQSGDDADDGGDPEVPYGVIRGINDLVNGKTASKDDLESVLKS